MPGSSRARHSVSPDELASAEAKQAVLYQVAPRQTAQGVIADTESKGRTEVAGSTPQAKLRQLAGLIHKPSTPLRRTSSGGTLSMPRTIRRTPGQTRIAGYGPTGRSFLGKSGGPATPHAIRALQQRRNAALTPGRDRRRSGRGQRDTPRDTLRNLSKILARGTLPTQQSPQVSQNGLKTAAKSEGADDLDIDPDLPQPRLSMRIDEDEDEDDGNFMLPPNLSMHLEDDENNTQRSIEFPRRAVSERPYGKPSRISFESLRSSDRFADLNELGFDAYSDDRGDDSYVRRHFGSEDYEGSLSERAEETVENALDSHLALSLEGRSHSRQSGVRPERLFEDEGENTFRFDVPQVIYPEIIPPRPESSVDLNLDSSRLEIGLEASPKYHPNGTKSNQINRSNLTRTSKHGIQYPSLPAAVIKKIASRFNRTSGRGRSKLDQDSLRALFKATDWFFKQVGEDLGAYAHHANRKSIDEADMIILMKRQRQVTSATTPFSLAQSFLPRELLQGIRMEAHTRPKTKKP